MTQLGSNVQLGSDVQMGLVPNFNPLWLDGCVAWFDMQDDRSYSLTGSTVTSIVNKASGVAWTEVTAPPTFSATGFNGLPCMSFNGSTQKIISTEAAVVAALAASTANTVFYVAKTNTLSLAAGAVVFGGGVATGTNLRNINYWGMTGATAKNTYGGATSAGASFAVLSSANANTNTNVSSWDNTGTTASLYTNGGVADPSAGAASSASCNPTRYAIGCIPTVTPQGFWNGNIAEVLVFNRVLTPVERTMVNLYLSRKWGLYTAGAIDPIGIVTSASPFWFVSADRDTTIVTGVSNWVDQTGNGNTFSQATTASQPALVTADPDFGGRNSLLGDGSNDYMTNVWVPPGPLVSTMWFFMVFQQVTWGSGHYLFAGSISSAVCALLQSGSTPAMSQANATVANNNTGAAVGTSVRGEVRFGGSTADYTKLGSTTVTGSSAFTMAGLVGLRLFTRNNGTAAQTINAKVACIGCWNAEPTAAEKAALDAWVTAYYGPTIVV